MMGGPQVCNHEDHVDVGAGRRLQAARTGAALSYARFQGSITARRRSKRGQALAFSISAPSVLWLIAGGYRTTATPSADDRFCHRLTSDRQVVRYPAGRNEPRPSAIGVCDGSVQFA